MVMAISELQNEQGIAVDMIDTLVGSTAYESYNGALQAVQKDRPLRPSFVKQFRNLLTC